MLESLLNKAAGLTPILKDRYFVKNCFCTAHTPLIVFFRFTLYSAPSSSSSQLLLRSSRPEVFLEISQNSLENTCVRVSFFNKIAEFRPWQDLGSDAGVFL